MQSFWDWIHCSNDGGFSALSPSLSEEEDCGAFGAIPKHALGSLVHRALQSGAFCCASRYPRDLSATARSRPGSGHRPSARREAAACCGIVQFVTANPADGMPVQRSPSAIAPDSRYVLGIICFAFRLPGSATAGCLAV